MTLEQAFWIMQRFLEAYWKRGGGEATSKPSETTDIGGLLGSISILSDGGTADPAELDHWLKTADSVIHGGVGPLRLNLRAPQK